MNKEHVLLCVLGRSASGKDSLVNMFCERTGSKSVISYTTRARRENEGDTHIFTTKETYKQMKAEGNIAAHTKIAGNYYWTTIDQLYTNDIYIIDYLGYEVLQSLNLPNLKLVAVYIHAPYEIRKERAINKRKDDIKKFIRRSKSEDRQFKKMAKKLDFDYAIKNIDFTKAFSVFKWIATVEGIWKGDNTK